MMRAYCISVLLSALITQGARGAGAVDWTLLPVPGAWESTADGTFADYDGFAWYRCYVKVPATWSVDVVHFVVGRVDNAHEAYVNGVKIGGAGSLPPAYRSGYVEPKHYAVPVEALRTGRFNLIAMRIYDAGGHGGMRAAAPTLYADDAAIQLEGDWEFRTGDDPAWATWSDDAPVPKHARFENVVTDQDAVPTRERKTALSPAESMDHLTVPDDLRLDLVASEPAVAQPVFLNFDERGRMWVCQYRQYPKPAGLTVKSHDRWWRAVYDKVPAAPPYHFPGKDMITIHEDTNGDGAYDKQETFLDGLSIVTSVARGRGGVWVLNPPYLLFFADADGDDVPDGDPEVHLSGFGLEDTHSVTNSLRWGPDGWLYATQGSTVTGDVKRPGLDDEPVHSLGQLVWRYHPETKRYEIFAEGGGNAFGVEFDAKGRVFSGHNGGDTRGFHYVQGGYYRKGFNKHGPLSNPYAFGYFNSMRHHSVKRFTHVFVMYEADALPAPYSGRLFGINPVERYVVMSEVEPDGSSVRTQDVGYAITSGDNWFRPVDIKVGPDGAIYVADFYDRKISHVEHREGILDSGSGRIYRLAARDAQPAPRFDLSKQTTRELIDLLGHDSKWFRQTALRLIGDRKDRAFLPLLRSMVHEGNDQRALEALWAVNLTGGFDDAFALKTLDHADPFVRAWTVRLLGDARSVTPAIAKRLARLAATEPHVEVRSQLACTTRRLPGSDALPIVRGLLTHDEDVDDVHLPLLLWWAIEAKADSDRENVVKLFEDQAQWKRPMVTTHILERIMRRYAMAGTSRDLATCARLLTLAPDADTAKQLMAGFEKAFEGRAVPHLPESLVAALDRHGLGTSRALGLRLGRPAAVTDALRTVTDGKTDLATRLRLVRIFGEVDQPTCVPVLLILVEAAEPEALRVAAVSALQRYDDGRIAGDLLDAYPEFPAAVQAAVRTLLAGRKLWALELLRAVDADEVDADQVADDLREQIKLYDSEPIAELIRKHWSNDNGTTTAQKRTQIAGFAAVIDAGDGNPYEGKKLFAATCGSCHTLYGDGGQVGPDLTSYQRNDLDAMLTSIVDVSAEIREGFENHIVMTTDGLTVTGFLADQDNRTVALRRPGGETLRIARDQIEVMQVLPRSIMPEKLLDPLTERQLRDLFAYLRTTQPIDD